MFWAITDGLGWAQGEDLSAQVPAVSSRRAGMCDTRCVSPPSLCVPPIPADPGEFASWTPQSNAGLSQGRSLARQAEKIPLAGGPEQLEAMEILLPWAGRESKGGERDEKKALSVRN